MGVQRRWERTKWGVEVRLFGNKVFVCVLTVSLHIFWGHYNDSMTFERININIKYPNGEVGPLILETDKCFSFGVQSNRDRLENGSGYNLPIVMLGRTSKGN